MARRQTKYQSIVQLVLERQYSGKKTKELAVDPYTGQVWKPTRTLRALGLGRPRRAKKGDVAIAG